MKVENGKRVKLEYELAVDGGEVIESSETQGPLEYLHGSGQMLVGLEKRIAGLDVGEGCAGVLAASEAYGATDHLPERTLSRDEFPQSEELEAGKSFEAKGPKGPVSFTVVAIEGDQVRVRFNHPLADKDIRYRVKVLGVENSAPI